MNFAEEYSKRKYEFEKHLRTLTDSFEGYPQQLSDAMAYSLLNGGKRLRPVLFTEAARMVGGEINESCADLSLAIECIHTYSLIHDDLPCMDNDDFRRGQPTCHKKFGEANAVLAGDALLNLAYELIFSAIECGKSQPCYIKAGSVIAKAAGGNGLIGGQICDLSQEVSCETIDYIYEKKTGELIKAALTAGAIAGNADNEVVEKIGAFGDLFGYAFQLKDDLLDKDSQDNSKTYIGIYGEDKTIKTLHEKTSQAVAILKDFDESDFLTKLVTNFMERVE